MSNSSDIVASNQRILAFLAQGMSASQVLSIVGCSMEYLKTLLGSEEFKEALQVEAAKYAKEAKEEEIVTNKYLSLEHKLLKRLEGESALADFRDVVRALEVVGNRQDKIANRKAGLVNNTSNVNTTINHVTLNMPTHAIPEYTLSSNSEVVQIDGKTMVALSSATVKEMFEARRDKEKLVVGL
jgi:tRNA A37 N6-isopentenylltransferase MiaA